MKATHPELTTLYKQALEQYLDVGGEAPLHEAYALGRKAVDSDIGQLNFIHTHQAVLSYLWDKKNEIPIDTLKAADHFLLESLAPYQMLMISNAESNAALRRLNQKLEEEAKRIANTLHDEAAQMLASVYLEIAEIQRDSPPAPVRAHLENIISQLDQVREQLRRLSHELRPPILDTLGLLPALRFLAEGIRKRDKLDVNIIDMTATNSRFPQSIETALYRATQEALNNVVRHAKATHAEVCVTTEDNHINCTITDDGIGLVPAVPNEDKESHGLGLLGIRERINNIQGTFTVNSTPGKGMELSIQVPVPNES